MSTPLDPAPAEPRSCGACCTRLTHFGVTLGGAVVLEDVNLHMHCGELTALIGPNGGGKTTLLRAILGDVPHSGDLQFIPSRQADWHTGAPRIGYVPQKLEFDPTAPVTVLDLFATASSAWPVWIGHRRATRQTAEAALDVVGAKLLLHHRLGQLSGGQMQRVFLALALTPMPNLLLLDEPVSGVDQAGIHLFYHMVADLRQRYDLSILFVSHDLTMAGHVSDRMVYLNRTVACEGPPGKVLAHPLVQQTFGLVVAEDEYRPNPQPVDMTALHPRNGRRAEDAL